MNEILKYAKLCVVLFEENFRTVQNTAHSLNPRLNGYLPLENQHYLLPQLSANT